MTISLIRSSSSLTHDRKGTEIVETRSAHYPYNAVQAYGLQQTLHAPVHSTPKVRHLSAFILIKFSPFRKKDSLPVLQFLNTLILSEEHALHFCVELNGAEFLFESLSTHKSSSTPGNSPVLAAIKAHIHPHSPGSSPAETKKSEFLEPKGSLNSICQLLNNDDHGLSLLVKVLLNY